MESLELAQVLLCANSTVIKGNLRATRQFVFNSPSKRTCRNGSLRLRSSLAGGKIGEGPSSFEDDVRERKSERALILTKETDASGLPIGFHLIPHSEEETTDRKEQSERMQIEESEDAEGEEKAQPRVTHNIVFVTSEASPYSKTGGLVELDIRSKIHCFGGVHEVGFFHEYRKGVDWVFVDHPSYRRPGNPYGDNYGAFGDNQYRFTLLCHTACEAPLVLPLGGFTYGDKCLFLVNDWHASLVPVLLAAKYRPHGVYKDSRCILVIHNIAHQGVEPLITYGLMLLTRVKLKQGLFLGDNNDVLYGITNGIDVAEWDPSSDEHIACHYSADDFSGKVQCKISLQKELGLPVRPDCPLIGFIGRLDYQKGIDQIRLAIPELMEDDVQFIMLGSGNPDYEDWMRATESTYRDKFRGWVGFNIPVSHIITAGCDILLMPSAFEPCGLNQLYAMRYGTIPVVHETGGLRDTVHNFNPYAEGGKGDGTGWTFSPLTKASMLAALRCAMVTYREHKSSWVGLMRRGMTRDFTWDSAAAKYEQVFDWAFIDPPYVS
ncbi:hypothetical protein K1719_044780 [Acacia pycnantha]|nr:hypothetical protein K1719_044780 [Acacia pycnantha]